LYQSLLYYLTNQNTFFAGFIPNHLVRTKYVRYFHPENTLITKYQYFITKQETIISTNNSNISTNNSNISTNNSNISINNSNISTNDPNISTNNSGISTNNSNISLNVPNMRTNNSGIISNKFNLLRKTALISGYKAFVSVCTLFREWNKAFLFKSDLFLRKK